MSKMSRDTDILIERIERGEEEKSQRQSDKPDSQACEASLDDLERGALAHYEDVSSKAHHWSNVVPRAIRFYFDAQRKAKAPLPELQRIEQEPVAWLYDNQITKLTSYEKPTNRPEEWVPLYAAPVSTTGLLPPTEEEIGAYRDTFRAELDKRMDLGYRSASPSTESHAIALRGFIDGRNARSARQALETEHFPPREQCAFCAWDKTAAMRAECQIKDCPHK